MASVLDVADGVGLRVLQRDEGNHQVAPRLGGEVLVLRGYVGEEVVAVQPDFVASLLEGDAEDVFVLNGRGLVCRGYLDDVVRAFALALQYLQGFRGIARGNDAVGHFAVDEGGRLRIAHVAQGNEVAVAGHAVGTTGTDISIGQRRERQALHKINLLQCLVQRQANGGARRADVLERRGRRHPGSLFQFLHQLPSVQRVQEIDVAGTAVQHFNGQFPLLHIDAGRLLIGVAAVLQC